MRKYGLNIVFFIFGIIIDSVLIYVVIHNFYNNRVDFNTIMIFPIIILLLIITFTFRIEVDQSEYKKLVLNYPIIRIPYVDFILIHSVFGFLPWYVISYKKNYRQITGYMILPVNNSMEIVKTILDKNPNCVINNTLAKKVKRYEKYLERKERLPL